MQNCECGEFITNSIGMKMQLIPEGEFIMGDEGWDDSKPLHRVRLTKPFYLGIYPVTQREWVEVMGSTPSEFKGFDLPVERVSWDDCQQFIEKMNEREHGGCYRLPTEAEWEYACRASSTKRYCFGDRGSELGHYAWYDDNSGDKTHPIGKKKPNAWGLYDMHGNVWEWCHDWYGANYYEKCNEKGVVEDPMGPESGGRRVARGGSYGSYVEYCSAGRRAGSIPRIGCTNLGVRLARSL